MSPEQASGEPLDGRSDLYSLGVVAFFAVTGRLPFEADSAGALMAMHITQPAPRVSSLRPDLPQSLTSAIDRLLEKDPARRFESGEAIASALDPLRASRREISPLVRQFNIEAGTAFRAVLLITLFSSYLSLQGGGDLDVLMPLLIGGGIVWGVAAQMVGRARSLQRTGFSFDEVRAGLRAILDERLEARSLDRADPISRRRESMRRRTMIFAAAAGVYGFVHVFRYMRTKVNEHMYAVNRPGVVLLFASAILVGIALALFMMSPTRSLNVERLIVKIWTGPVGRAVFRLASWRLGATAHRGESSPTSATSGPMLLFASLSGALRRELGDAKSGIEALEQALRALGEKQRGIEEAIADAGTITASTDPALQARRMELVRDLTKARDDAITKRERLAGALENVRVQLLRLKSGVGSASDVSAELRTARGFVG